MWYSAYVVRRTSLFVLRFVTVKPLTYRKCNHSNKIFDFAAKAKAAKCDIHEHCYLHSWTKNVGTKLCNTLKSLELLFLSDLYLSV